MQKHIIFLLAAALIVFSGCGAKKQPADNARTVILKAAETNMGCVDMCDPEQWLQTRYTVYADGTVDKEDVYGSETEEETVKEKICSLPDDGMEKILAAERAIRKGIPDTEAYDGTKWSFTYFHDGQEDSSWNGYIYGIKDLESAAEALGGCR